MNFLELIKYLKITYENIFNLHHNIQSANYYADHEKMAEYYELVQKIADDMIESGLIIGVREPTISECAEKYEVIDTTNRSAIDCYKIVFEYFNDIIDLMDIVKEQCPDWLKSKIEEHQYALNIEANFKIKHLLGLSTPEQ